MYAFGGCFYYFEWYGRHNGETYLLGPEPGYQDTAYVTLACGDTLQVNHGFGTCAYTQCSLTRDGVLVEGQHSQLTEPGFYDLNLVTEMFDLHFRWQLTFSDCDEVGIAAPASNEASLLSVWPTPMNLASSARLQVRVQLRSGMDVENRMLVRITSADGRIVMQPEVHQGVILSLHDGGEGKGEGQFSIDVGGLLSGAYCLQVGDGRSWMATEKFMIE